MTIAIPPASRSIPSIHKKNASRTCQTQKFVGDYLKKERLSGRSTRRVLGRRPKIAVDVDEVLGQFLVSLNAYYLETFAKSYDISHYDEYYFCKIWDMSPEAAEDVVHNFYKSHHFTDGINPVPGALAGLKELKSKCDLVVITSRQNVIQDMTRKWIETHYPGIFSEIYFCNHFAKDGTSISKSKMASRVGADMLIDDNPGYAIDCATNGLDVILFDYESRYPWSKACKEHERIHTCGSWSDVLKKISQLYFMPSLLQV